jgi:hypothetical protein
MPLPDFLSAIRELILDDGLPPGQPDQRRSELGRRFPKLSASELDDLVAVPPQRLAVYTDLVFAGQRGTLLWIFPATFAVMHKLEGLAEESPEARQYDFELTRALHRFRSWKDSSTRSLARDFESFILAEHGRLINQWPGLADLVRFEKIELEVFYAPDETIPRTRVDQLESLTRLSVEALMLVRVIRPGHAAMHEFACDVLSLIETLRRDGELPDLSSLPRGLTTICGRSITSLSPQWIRLDAASKAAIGSIGLQSPTPLNDLAQAYVTALPADARRTDQAAFQSFFTQLTRWLSAGSLLLCPT